MAHYHQHNRELGLPLKRHWHEPVRALDREVGCLLWAGVVCSVHARMHYTLHGCKLCQYICGFTLGIPDVYTSAEQLWHYQRAQFRLSPACNREYISMLYHKGCIQW